MNQIKNYIEAMFSSLPKTKEVVEMKLNMIDNMEEKYEALIAEGKKENEAIGIVVSQFGSIDELRSELGIQVENEEMVNVRLGEFEGQNQRHAKKSEKYQALRGIVWMITIILFLMMGLMFQLWNPGWIIFLLAVVVQKYLDYKAELDKEVKTK